MKGEKVKFVDKQSFVLEFSSISARLKLIFFVVTATSLAFPGMFVYDPSDIEPNLKAPINIYETWSEQQRGRSSHPKKSHFTSYKGKRGVLMEYIQIHQGKNIQECFQLYTLSHLFNRHGTNFIHLYKIFPLD